MKNHILNLTLLICCTLMIFSLTATAQDSGTNVTANADYSRIDSYVQSMMRDCRIPGFSLAVVRGKEVPWAFTINYSPDAGWLALLSSVALLLLGMVKGSIIFLSYRRKKGALSS